MKKAIILSVIGLACAVAVSGQTLSKKEAKTFFNKTQSYLKTSDTAAFISLW